LNDFALPPVLRKNLKRKIKMKILLIGGTGTISMYISKRLLSLGNEVYLLNRGNRTNSIADLSGAKFIVADIHNESEVAQKINNLPFSEFDCVANFIAYNKEDLERDFRLFSNRTKQFIFISTASAYQKPPLKTIITEETPLENSFWEYSRKKSEGEKFLMEKFLSEKFPVTIVRPSHTYDERKVPVAIHGKNGSFQVLARMLSGKPVIIHGDGTSLWTVTHSSDFARAFTALVGNEKSIGQAVQIMSEENLCWNRIYEIIADSIGVKLNCVHISTDFLCKADNIGFGLQGNLWGDKAWSVQFDTSKLKSLVPDFKPEISMEEGIAATAKNVIAHKEFQKPDEEFDLWCDKVIAAYNTAFESL